MNESAFSKAQRVSPEFAMNNAGRCFFAYEELESLAEYRVVMYGVSFKQLSICIPCRRLSLFFSYYIGVWH